MDVKLGASLKNSAYLRTRIANLLCKVGINKHIINSIKLAFSEVASNFIEHSPSIFHLSVKLIYSPSHLALHIFEHSSQCNQHAMEQWLTSVNIAKSSKNPVLDTFDINRSGGRGAALVAELVDSIECTPVNKTEEDGESIWKSGFTLNWNISKSQKKQNILIVDDDKALSKLYSNYLSSEYNVICASTVKHALAELDTHTLDLILSDIHMPVDNGVEFRKKVSLHKKAMNTPFIFMSGDKKADEFQTLSKLGIDDFLIKPITKKDLLSRVSRTLKRIEQLNKLNDLLRTQSITQSLIPNIPNDLEAWNLSAISKGPGEGGGDLVIVKKQNQGYLLIIADLMGHDIAAKFFAHAYLGYIRGVLCASSPEPEAFLSLLSNAIYEDELLSKSLCTCCAIKLLPNGSIRIASAGHPTPILISNERKITLDIGGMLPGLMPNIVYASKEYQLIKGERLAVFTDGFMDSSTLNMNNLDANNGAKSHLDTVSEMLDNTLNMPQDKALKSIFSTISDTKGTPFEDDTLLVLVEPNNMD